MIDPTLAEFARRIPKAELHVHIDGTLEPEMKLEIARRNGVPLAESTTEEIRASYVFHDLPTFLAVHYPNMAVLRTEQDYFDLCQGYLARAHAQGVRHVEIFFDPQLHTSRGVAFGTMIGGYRRAILSERERTGISAELIMCFLRDRGIDDALATWEQSEPYRDWMIGVGLDSDEKDHPPVEFVEVFSRARQAGLRVTVHCDIDQENTHEHIRQALVELQVDRIDHGTNVVEDAALLALARERGIGFTVCPLSNSFVTATMKADEIVALVREGIPVSISSDDPPYFGGYAGDNYAVLADRVGAQAADVAAWARSSFRAAWLPPDRREAYLADVDRFVREYPAISSVT
ncbi:adenosine deaminase [Microbacterium sp. SORGH_AS_0862]|uniref:adenosine deaminase n=1 Tax=Microbacterium sp. SORGH_AS_0862 TaxID=3041789 RepID=UPI00278E8AAF|nr:adenosine deaminase [Microbacterium sp. SORGH_AS_0862]MDQ1204594.1 adenosine deaminase [Microbacterium sp. SORGH_AS_0862]